MATQKIMTISEVAELLKVHPITVYRLIKQGKLPYFRIGRILRFDADQLEDWLRITQRNVVSKNGRRKRKIPSSAEYVAYRRGEKFNPERSLETLAISRPLLVRSFIDVRRLTGSRSFASDAARPVSQSQRCCSSLPSMAPSHTGRKLRCRFAEAVLPR